MSARISLYSHALFRYQLPMIETVEPQPIYRTLSEVTVAEALKDPDPANPIAIEVARLIDGYTSNFHAHVERLGRIPSEILRMKPRWPIEAVAMRLFTEAIRETVASSATEKG
jgi:hypothetical protein